MYVCRYININREGRDGEIEVYVKTERDPLSD